MTVADWPEVRIEAPPGDAHAIERLEAWLFEAGALSVTLLDSEDEPSGREAAARETPATLAHAVLEPAPGETRLWHAVTLVGLFEQGADAGDIRDLLASAAATVGLDPPPPFALAGLEDEPWERAWMRDFHAMRFGPRFVVAPHELDESDADSGISADDIVLRLDPGLAFGTGTHPTTALCLEWLGAVIATPTVQGSGSDIQSAPFAGRRVLDYGCGSGVLAIGAALLGSTELVAVDIDAQALAATADNARANGVAGRIAVGLPEALVAPLVPGAAGEGAFDVLLANILHGPLTALASTFAAVLVDDGDLVLSGVLEAQSESLRLRYTPWFDFQPDLARDGWVLLTARRRPRARR